MHCIARIVLVCVLLFSGQSRAADAPALTGQWHATLQTAAGALALELTVTQSAQGVLAASLESLDQNPGEPIRVSQVKLDQDRLTLSIDSLSAKYEGRYDAAKDQWDGQWRQGRTLSLVWLRGRAPSTPLISGLDGDWNATLERNGASLRLILHVLTDKRGTRARMDSPDMGLVGMDVTELRREGTRVHLRVPLASVSFDATLDETGRILGGSWRRAGMAEVQLRFTRAAAAAPAADQRRQTPRAPLGYSVTPVHFASTAAEIMLSGTLTRPFSSDACPAVVLLSGTGPQDRDEAMFGHRPFWVLADYLTRRGIAVLRVDDRGVGGSGGVFERAKNADFAADARSAVAFLAQQPGIDAGAIGLIGHSQGGAVATLAAAHNRSVAYLVLLAAPATSIEDLLLAQRRATGVTQGMSGPALAANEAAMSLLLRTVARAPDRNAAADSLAVLMTPDLLSSLGITQMQQPALIDEISADWLSDLLRYDARAELRAQSVPMLALYGGLDTQVAAASNIAAFRAATVGKPGVDVRELAGINHMFQHARSGRISEYPEIEETFAPTAMEAISGWIGGQFGVLKCAGRVAA